MLEGVWYLSKDSACVGKGKAVQVAETQADLTAGDGSALATASAVRRAPPTPSSCSTTRSEHSVATRRSAAATHGRVYVASSASALITAG